MNDRREREAERRARRAAADDPAVVMEAAAAFLAVRPRSVAETRRRLRHLGYPPTLAEQVIDQLIELGYLDDVVFARAWVESRDRSRPRGEMLLRSELQQKGVDPATVASVLEERRSGGADDQLLPNEPPDLLAARRLVGRHGRSWIRESDPRKRMQKAYALLARNGFDAQLCTTVSREVAVLVELESVRADGAATED